MATYVIGQCDSGWFPEYFTETDNEDLLDEYCDLQYGHRSEDAVHAYERLSDDDVLDITDIQYVSEGVLQQFVEHLRNQIAQYTPYYFGRFE